MRNGAPDLCSVPFVANMSESGADQRLTVRYAQYTRLSLVLDHARKRPLFENHGAPVTPRRAIVNTGNQAAYGEARPVADSRVIDAYGKRRR